MVELTDGEKAYITLGSLSFTYAVAKQIPKAIVAYKTGKMSYAAFKATMAGVRQYLGTSHGVAAQELVGAVAAGDIPTIEIATKEFIQATGTEIMVVAKKLPDATLAAGQAIAKKGPGLFWKGWDLVKYGGQKLAQAGKVGVSAINAGMEVGDAVFNGISEAVAEGISDGASYVAKVAYYSENGIKMNIGVRGISELEAKTADLLQRNLLSPADLGVIKGAVDAPILVGSVDDVAPILAGSVDDAVVPATAADIAAADAVAYGSGTAAAAGLTFGPGTFIWGTLGPLVGFVGGFVLSYVFEQMAASGARIPLEVTNLAPGIGENTTVHDAVAIQQEHLDLILQTLEFAKQKGTSDDISELQDAVNNSTVVLHHLRMLDTSPLAPGITADTDINEAARLQQIYVASLTDPDYGPVTTQASAIFDTIQNARVSGLQVAAAESTVKRKAMMEPTDLHVQAGEPALKKEKTTPVPVPGVQPNPWGSVPAQPLNVEQSKAPSATPGYINTTTVPPPALVGNV